MEQFTLSVEPRVKYGSSSNQRLRKEGRLPAVLYSGGKNATSLSVNRNEFVRLAKLASVSQLFTLASQDKELDGRLAIVKTIQKDYARSDEPLHIDFFALEEGVEVHVEIPLGFVGEAPGVKIGGGILTIATRQLEVVCLPKLIPNKIEISVSALEVGESIHAHEIALPEGVRLAGAPDETIVGVLASRMTILASKEEGAAGEGEAEAKPAGEEKKE
ncbi:MAG: 50S ribosomal protein L25 [Deltaproteobacteria bacterium]|nr:50S ribosomal protein L25 [Deltaproteobacteria bacterium]